MAKENPEFTYKIESYIGSLKESDKHDWSKSVMRIAWGDNMATLDIRNVNMKDKRIGKGISLSDEEADKLTDILLENGYGSMECIKESLEKKKSIFTIADEIDAKLLAGEELSNDEPIKGPVVIDIGA